MDVVARSSRSGVGGVKKWEAGAAWANTASVPIPVDDISKVPIPDGGVISPEME